MDIVHRRHKKKVKLRPINSDSHKSNIGIPLMIVLSLIALLFGVLCGSAISVLIKYCN